MRKTIISLLVVICCLTSQNHVVAQDFITEISTPNQLAELARQVNEGKDYSGQTVTLTADIDLSNFKNWTPIGIYAFNHYFNGTFNGQNHQITNLQVDAKATETGFVAGLFGVIGSAGTIKDLTVVTTEVRIKNRLWWVKTMLVMSVLLLVRILVTSWAVPIEESVFMAIGRELV